MQSVANGRVIQLLQPLDQTPDDLALAYLLGMALLREQRISEAKVLLDRILKNGDSAEARFLLNMQRYKSGDFPASIKQFTAASEVNPKLPHLQAYYAQALLTLGDPHGASAAFKRKLEQKSHNYTTNLGQSQALPQQPLHCAERQDHATMCTRKLHLPFSALIDGMDNKVEALYGAWPSRAFVIGRDDRIQYNKRLTQLGFSAPDIEASINTALRPRIQVTGHALLP